jgi:hypothetical protein
MYKAGNKVSATPRELLEMKENSRLLAEFIRLSDAWLNATAFTQARKTRAEMTEWKVWLTTGLWWAVGYNDGRAESTGFIYKVATQQACKAYDSAYESATAGRLREATSTNQTNDDGESVEADLIDLNDKSAFNLEFNSFMAAIESKVSERDYFVIQSRLKGETFEAIGEAIELSKQMAYKIWQKHLPKLKTYA